jgi:glycosyltransferase involved in cell wall biosynthesis
VLDLWPNTLEAVGVVRSQLLLSAVGKVVSFIYDRCDLILAQSRSFIPQIARHCRDPKPIAYFPNWAETLFDGRSDVGAVEIPLLPNSFDVMFAGNIGEAQDFPAILAAAELLKEHRKIRWLVVGDGRMASWVRQEILRRGLQERVLMLGRHPLEKMPAFYRHAQALLVSLKDAPIFAMTIPGKLQSYLTAGVPIIAMLNGEGADLVRRSDSGIACPAGDSRALAAAVLELVALPSERREEMGRNALRISADEFDRGELITRLEAWLRALQQRPTANLLV